MRHTDYCEARTDVTFRRSVNRADCPTCQAWTAGYVVGSGDGLRKNAEAVASAR